MGKFKKKFLFKLIVVLCLVFNLFNFLNINIVYAEDKSDDEQIWGGVLLKPIINLLQAIGDLIMEILHKSVQEQQAAIIKISGSETWWEKMAGTLAVVAGIVVAIIVIAVVIATSGAAAAGLAALAGTAKTAAFVYAAAGAVGKGILAGAVIGTIAGTALHKELIPNDIELPAFSITAEEIFRNKISLFDVNFFNPSEKTDSITDVSAVSTIQTFLKTHDMNWKQVEAYNVDKTDDPLAEVKAKINLTLKRHTDFYDEYVGYDYFNNVSVKYSTYNLEATGSSGYQVIRYEGNPDDEVEAEFNEVLSSVKSTYLSSTAAKLQNTVATWYYILRNIALIVLMLVLIYTGIRIVIGSTAGEKAKYKERLMDWLVAVCLVMIMHYIMVFAMEIVNSVTKLMGRTVNGNVIYLELTEIQRKHAKEVLKDWDTTSQIDGTADAFDDNYNGDAEGGALYWPTDLAGMFKINSQTTAEGTSLWAGYTLCYIVLVLFTLFFAMTYLKRVIYMAFLTIIAPLVAMTYPIDKMTDGKAQAFNSWLREYIFNLLIQPLHLLLYSILVSNAFELASSSPIYALVAVGFIMPAEKLMRKFFGFEKAQTPGLLGGAAGAALAMTGLQKLTKSKGHGGKYQPENTNSKDEDKVNFARKNNVDTMAAIAEGNEGRRLPSEHNTNTQNEDLNDVVKSQEKETLEERIADGQLMPNELTDEQKLLLGLEEKIPESQIDNIDNAKEIEDSDTKEIEEETKKHRGKSALRALGAIAKATGKGAARKVLTGVKPLKFAGKLALGTTGAMAGMLLGVTSGDFNKTLQYTATGGLAGNSLANSLSGKHNISEKTKKEIEMAYYGDDYKKHLIEEQEKAFIKNKDNINYLRQTLGVSTSEAKEILQDTGKKCLENGITSMEDIATIHKLTDKKQKDPLTFEKAVAGRSYAKSRLPSKIKQMDDEQVSSYKARWAKEFKEKGYTNGDYLAEEAFNMAIRYSKTQKSLGELDS